MTADRVRLWEAVNRYAQSCGGDTSAIASIERCNAVVAVERAVDALVVAKVQAEPAPVCWCDQRKRNEACSCCGMKQGERCWGDNHMLGHRP